MQSQTERDPYRIPLYNLTRRIQDPSRLNHEVASVQRSIAMDVISSRGVQGLKQYGLYFGSFWAYGLIDGEKARLIRSAYFWFRHVDDIADGDKSLPAGYLSRQEYLQHKINLIENIMLADPTKNLYGNIEDVLLVDYFLQADKLGITLGEESLAIVDTIIFDEQRNQLRPVLPQQQLDTYFDKLDFACIGGALKVGGDHIAPDKLSSLSRAVRTMFNLRDFPQDFDRGLYNISTEDLKRYGIDLARCEGLHTVEEFITYEPMRQWYVDQLVQGYRYLKTAKEIVSQTPLTLPTRLAIQFNFLRPTEQTLGKIKQAIVAEQGFLRLFR